MVSREAIFEASTTYFLGPVDEYLQDDSVTEIMVNGWGTVYIERAGRLELTTARFPDEDSLLAAIKNIAQWVGRDISPSRPILDARLPDGSRVHAIVPPASKDIYLSIRKFSPHVMGLPDLVRLGALSPEAQEFMELCVRLRKNIIISGGTGTGKTTFLNALSAAIPEDERIIVIEDTTELRLNQQHCLYLEAQSEGSQGKNSRGIRPLFVASLRMRPDRIIVGEVRSGEALDMVQAMLSGHSGSLTTVHASTPRDALIRLETLSLMSDVELPMVVARSQVGAAIHMIVQLSRYAEDGSRRITQITEVGGLDADQKYQLRDLFVSRYHGKGPDGRLKIVLEPTGEKPSFHAEAKNQGLSELIQWSQALWS